MLLEIVYINIKTCTMQSVFSPIRIVQCHSWIFFQSSHGRCSHLHFFRSRIVAHFIVQRHLHGDSYRVPGCLSQFSAEYWAERSFAQKFTSCYVGRLNVHVGSDVFKHLTRRKLKFDLQKYMLFSTKRHAGYAFRYCKTFRQLFPSLESTRKHHSRTQ